MSDMELAPLSQVSQEKLAPLFCEEASHWRSQLFWDYRPTLRLVNKLVAARSLPGFVLKFGRDVVGYAYFVFDRPVGFIGGLYVLDSYADHANYSQLIQRLVAKMRGIDYLDRIESQVMPFNVEFAPDFVKLGFKALPRYFLSVEIGRKMQIGSMQGVDEFGFQSWRPEFKAPAAAVIYDSYVESPDVNLCRDYQSQEGCARFLRNLIGTPACGKFSRTDTLVALSKEGEVCGVLLATEIDAGTGMIPQLSVLREYQGRGIGSGLLAEYMKGASRKGLKRVSLSVSLANSRAFDLYRRLGFKTVKEFHALIWEAPSAPSIDQIGKT
jgi:ribosomal protein S18 acetylase RimI-like enzyme